MLDISIYWFKTKHKIRCLLIHSLNDYINKVANARILSPASHMTINKCMLGVF